MTGKTIVHGREIMVVDDDAFIVGLLTDVLTSWGFSVTAFTSSHEAFNRFVYSPDDFDLLITDQMMPGLTGVELCRGVQRIRAGFPVVLCTGYSHGVNERNYREFGLSHYLTKPINHMGLQAVIECELGEVMSVDHAC